MKFTVNGISNSTFSALVLAALASCGNSGDGGDGGGGGGVTYTVGGTVTGLTGSGLTLQNNAGDDLLIGTDGPFSFPTAVVSGTAYSVEVITQPSAPTQNCVVTNGSSSAIADNVTNVSIECADAGRFAYVTNAGDDTISVYSIDSTTGALVAVGTPVPTGMSPYAIAGSPDKQHVYVVNQIPNSISAYLVDATSGALTEIAGSPFAAGTQPQAMVFNPSGEYLYVANNGSNDLSAYAVDTGSGNLTPLATPTYATGMGPSAVVVDPNGSFIFVANNGGSNNISVFAIAAGTGELTPVTGSPFAASVSPDYSPRSLVFAEPGGLYNLYVATFDAAYFLGTDVTAFNVDQVSGALTLLRSSAVTVDNYIATDRNGEFLYVTTGGAVAGYAIEDAGELFSLPGSSVAAGANAYSVTIDPSNLYLYVANDGDGSVSGYKRHNGELQPIPGSPFAAGHNPDFIAIL